MRDVGRNGGACGRCLACVIQPLDLTHIHNVIYYSNLIANQNPILLIVPVLDMPYW